ncbi:sushi, von Willebrand factor type A, EGF and pentraxin domain-containing protein 1-like [Crassostrea virginica]
MDSMLFIWIGIIFQYLGFSHGNTIQCPSILSIPISTSHGRTINLDDFVLNGNASFSPSQTVTLNVFTLNTPLKVKISALHEDGTRNTCTFLIYTKAEVCFKESLAHVSNAVQQCLDTGGQMSCTYTCNSGYVFYSGDVTRTVNCSEMNIWNPSPYPESCLKFNLPIFLAKFDVTYTIDGALAATCLAAFKQSLADTNTTISSNIDYFCRLLDPGLFIIESLDSSSLTFKILTTFRGRFDGFRSHRNRETCINLIHGIPDKSLAFPASSVQCSDNSQAAVTVDSMSNVEVGNMCNDNTTTFSAISNELCVRCPAGQYSNGSVCMICKHGFYQDEVGQRLCKRCEPNTVSRADGKTCISMCPPGFTSTDGFTDCKPCERDSFWINATHCENCPDGYRTTENGVPDIDGCKAPCQQGHYSRDGLTPCKPCPLHHFQYLKGQTSCQECKYKERTYETGRISSSECVLTDTPDCNGTALFGCKKGKVEFQNHRAFCVCLEDQISSGTTSPQGQDDTMLITLIALLCISVGLNLILIFRICRLSSKHHKKDKGIEDTEKIPNVVYDYVMDTGSTYQELGHVSVQHNYNNME